MKIEELVEKMGIGQRTLERNFKEVTGLTIKKYQMIQRLNELFEEVTTKEELEWSELAIKYGYFDQAHLIKELKKYLKNTPKEYEKAKDLIGDIFYIE